MQECTHTLCLAGLSATRAAAFKRTEITPTGYGAHRWDHFVASAAYSCHTDIAMNCRPNTVVPALLAMACFAPLASCTSPLPYEPVGAPVLRIVTGPTGFLLCSSCGELQPTAKHAKTQAAANEEMRNSTVPRALSISPNEQFVTTGVPDSTAKPSSVTAFFPSSQAHIGSAEARKLRSFLQTVPAGSTFFVTGYTDATGDPAANRQLADLRASAVRDFVMRSTKAQHVTVMHASACCSGAHDSTQAERARNRHATLEVSS